MNWISLNEQKPKHRQPILFWSDDVYIGVWYEHSNSVIGNVAGYQEDDVNKSCITHWMPLPEPPKEIEQ
jgi:hypothetical protein